MAIASTRSAPIGLVIGCIIFGLGSLIVAHVDIGGWAMSFWRLAISGIVFSVLAKITSTAFQTCYLLQSIVRRVFRVGFGPMAREYLCRWSWYFNSTQ